MDPATRQWLLVVARRALRAALAEMDPRAQPLPVPKARRPDDEILRRPSRLFVSWYDGVSLVGCIGSLEARLPLEEAVEHLSVQAALHDPRLPPASVEQWDQLRCEISVLDEPHPLNARGLSAISAAVVPGRDGVLLEAHGRRAFFLPQVWVKIPDRSAFLEALCRKAGLDPADARDEARAAVFSAEVFGEP